MLPHTHVNCLSLTLRPSVFILQAPWDASCWKGTLNMYLWLVWITGKRSKKEISKKAWHAVYARGHCHRRQVLPKTSPCLVFPETTGVWAQGGENQLLFLSSQSWLSDKWGFSTNVSFFLLFYGSSCLFFYARLLWNCPDPPSLHKEASWPPGGLHFFPSSQRALKSSPRGKQDKVVSSGTPQVGAFWTHPPHSRWLDALFYCLQHSWQSWTTIRTLRWTETSLWP